jgi:hypothetical protein
MDSRNAMFRASGDANRFKLLRLQIYELILNWIGPIWSKAKPIARHQVYLIFGSDVRGGSVEALQVLMLLDPSVHFPPHKLLLADFETKNNIGGPATLFV